LSLHRALLHAACTLAFCQGMHYDRMSCTSGGRLHMIC
jgi:hypothetical protein